MRYNLRDLRIFPIVVLSLFLLLIVINLRTRSRLSGAPLARGTGKAPAALKFDEFIPGIFDLQEGKAVADSVFLIATNEKSEEVMARVRYRTRKDEDQLLIFSWYLGDVLKERDTVWAEALDTLCKSVISIPRSEAGHWSVDIALKDNILLSTLSFELAAQNSAQQFRSLKGPGTVR